MGKHRKEEHMNEEMNTSELLKEVVEENQTRKTGKEKPDKKNS